jgi:hypothetical protein
MNELAYQALKKACENFVEKVENGKARSKRSYAEMKLALLLANTEEKVQRVCPDCSDRGELRDGSEQVTGVCPCHI